MPADIVDAVSNLRGVTRPVHDKISARWADFWAAHQNATPQEIEGFADQIDIEFGDQFWSP